MMRIDNLYMSCSLNSLKQGVYRGYIAECYKGLFMGIIGV